MVMFEAALRSPKAVWVQPEGVMSRRKSALRWLRLIEIVVAPVSGAGPAAGQCTYTIEFITHDCGSFGSALFSAEGGINDLAQVAGNASCGPAFAQAFTWDGGSIQFIDLPSPANSSFVRAVNDSFDVAGSAFVPDVGPVAFFLSGEEFFNLGIPEGGTYSRAHALNNVQQVVGRWGNVVTGDPAHSAFVWENGVMTDLGPLLDPELSHANDISTGGTIVGRIGFGQTAHAFMLKDGVVTLLGPIPGGYTSQAFAVNSFDEVVGVGLLKSDCNNSGFTSHAFLWQMGSMLDLGVLPEMCGCFALDINDLGQIVGYCETDLDSAPFLWQDGKMIDLYTLVPPEFNLLLGSAFAINNAGQILVNGGNYDTGDFSLMIFTPGPKIPADFSCDGVVNAVDLAAIISTWAQTNAPPTDLTGEGAVGPADLAELLANWDNFKVGIKGATPSPR